MHGDLETILPRCWTNPKAANDRPTLVRLEPGGLELATVPAPDLDRVVDDLEQGGRIASLVIPVESITGARGDQDGSQLKVSYLRGTSQSESRTIDFADRSQRDEFAATLAAVMGPGWEFGTEPMSRWKAGAWTMLPTVVVAIVTGVMHTEAVRIAGGLPPWNWGKGGKPRLLGMAAHWMEAHLGATGVLIAGGALVAVGVLIFTAVMAWPPESVVVWPTSGEPS